MARVGLDEVDLPRAPPHDGVNLAEEASIAELVAVMGWAPSTAVAMRMRYGHLFAARDEHLTEALDQVYRSARGS